MKNLYLITLFLWGTNAFAYQQQDSPKPTKVVFRGIFKFPEYEFYTINKGVKVAIKESTELTLDPWASVVLRAVNLHTNEIVAREKLVYMTIPTEVILNTLKDEKILYIRKIQKGVVLTSQVVEASPKTEAKPVKQSAEATKPFVKLKPGTAPEKDQIRPGKAEKVEEKALVTTKVIKSKNTPANTKTNSLSTKPTAPKTNTAVKPTTTKNPPAKADLKPIAKKTEK